MCGGVCIYSSYELLASKYTKKNEELHRSSSDCKLMHKTVPLVVKIGALEISKMNSALV